MESSKKSKFLQIPIISHDSEKPSLIFEEMSSGNLYSSNKSSKNDEKCHKKCTTNINKKFVEIPIRSHESEKPSIVFEENSFKKLISNTQTPNTIKSHQKNLKTVKNGKYKEIPVIAHDSENPSICYEEDSYGNINPNIPHPIYINKEEINNYKNKKENILRGAKKIIESGKDIVEHESELPLIAFEEISSGIRYKALPTLPTTFKRVKDSKIINSGKKDKNYDKSEIVIHESESPSIVFEEINSGINYKTIPTSLTIFKCNKDSEKKCDKSEIKIHESEMPSMVFEERDSGVIYKNFPTSVTDFKCDKDSKKPKTETKIEKCDKTEIPIHESEMPSLVFEETNGGSSYKSYPTSVSDYKEDKILRANKCEPKNKKYEEKTKKVEKTEIKVYESEKPSFVFEQINSGKLFSNVRTSETESAKLKKLKKEYDIKEVSITVHKSEKPKLVFEESNTGIMIDFRHII